MLPLIVLVGATGTGKTALSLELAARLASAGRPTEIVNADAMQLYRGMDIGTAKLPIAERRGIPHHMFDVLDVTDEASVADYQVQARAVIGDILARGAVPIMVGGSGLYVSSVIYDFRFPGTDAAVRARLEAELAEVGPGILFQRLRQLDPAAAESIGPHNARRIVRALEVVELTGEPFGSGLPDEGATWHADTRVIGVRAERAELVARLDERVEGMWRDGLLDEVRMLRERGIERGVTASRAIGYAQAIGELRGELSQGQAIELTQALTRKYARRQVSWFRRYAATTWFDHDAPALIEDAFALSVR
ncbi:tRNA dimethylallyltransferase [Homoserinimonas aerilata]|uniref:tRNA dimethylallyltransferase n=1 Tax=Homoserinimonas aerilata TaxID=1162970 RepID=A0A542YJX9_9MICO|nr:tRNA (adenosine(37)-N6)-dimethylallyltransferase MiaA [Homoserinimonas aerilata]TQL48361.1 tRNA dimethylallyltransferase [Homoserinimonas aerilata]